MWMIAKKNGFDIFKHSNPLEHPRVFNPVFVGGEMFSEVHGRNIEDRAMVRNYKKLVKDKCYTCHFLTLSLSLILRA